MYLLYIYIHTVFFLPRVASLYIYIYIAKAQIHAVHDNDNKNIYDIMPWIVYVMYIYVPYIYIYT